MGETETRYTGGNWLPCHRLDCVIFREVLHTQKDKGGNKETLTVLLGPFDRTVSLHTRTLYPYTVQVPPLVSLGSTPGVTSSETIPVFRPFMMHLFPPQGPFGPRSRDLLLKCVGTKR